MMRTATALSALALLVACSQPTSQTDTPPVSPEGAQADAGDSSAEPALLMPLPTDTTAAVTVEDLAQRIAMLADDTFEGRGPASEKGEQAADWIAAEFDRIGLSPAGENGTWFQTVDMVEQTLDQSASKLSFSGGASGAEMPMTLGETAVMWTKRINDLELSFDNSELVFVGYGIVAPEYGWNDYAGLDMTGKTAVILVNDPGYARGDDLFKGRAMTYYGRWTYKFEEAARQGATGAIIVHETAPAAYGWDVVRNSWSGAQADLVRADGGASRTVFEGWVTEDTARTLFTEAGLDFDTLKAAAQTEDFVAVDMANLTASGEIAQTVSTTQSRNVVGTLTGTTASDEYVLVTAHWDHLGKKTGEKAGQPGQDFYRDEIYNGAVDNATGMAAMFEVAEGLADTPPQRSALFVAVTLEESGLLGSAFYAEHPTVPLKQIVAGVNFDAMRPVGRTNDMFVIGYGASQLEDILKGVLEASGRIVRPDQHPEAGYFYRSDHISFAKKGVPMLYAKEGLDKIDGGEAAGEAWVATYTAQRYHKPMDEFNDTWDLSGTAEDVAAMLAVVRSIADSTDWPTWYPGNEFEAIRQASLAGEE